MPIEDNFDVPFIAAHARREKQIQQNYRPIIAVHKWFARRPGTLFRGLLLAEFCKGPLREQFYRSHDFDGVRIADPFMGGGIPLLEANRIGCDVAGFDINPMAYWIVREEIEHIDLTAYKAAADRFLAKLRDDLADAYQTHCMRCNSTAADVKYFLWVKRRQCVQCRKPFDLFPGYLGNDRVRRALATNFSDLLRYQNMLCRYDTAVLKSLDIFSVHGFPVGLVQCESNLFGIRNLSGKNVGSGGWENIIAKYAKAKSFCDEPFEVSSSGRKAAPIPTPGEWIGEQRAGRRPRKVRVECADATKANMEEGTLDAVFTDPPYFGNVQYAELMEFCYVWLRRLAGADPALLSHTVRDPEELTGNATFDRGIEHFTDGLSRVFQRMAAALKPTAPLAFTYHHNDLDAYQPLVVAILDAGLICTRVIPCPAEMGGSIHINGTQSSTIDSVFVCRRPGVAAVSELPKTAKQLAAAVADDLSQLAKGGVKASAGDIHCITCGHLARIAIATLRPAWDPALPVSRRLGHVASAIGKGVDLGRVKQELQRTERTGRARSMPLFDSEEEQLEGVAK